MPELRQDVVTGHWVVVATGRAARPHDFVKQVCGESMGGECPFCSGHETSTPPELFALRLADSEPDAPGWQVRVVPNKFPAFRTGEPVRPSTPMFPRRPADGCNEVIIHSPDHHASLATMPVDNVEKVLRVYRQRYRVHSRDEHIRYVHILVNHGIASGASMEHSHSQLFGVPMVPQLLQAELAGASWFYTKRSACILCSMVAEEIEADQRLVAKNRRFLAFTPFASRLPFEVWIVPRFHQESYGMIDDEQIEDFALILKDVLGKYYRRFDDPSYNYYLHTAPCDGSDYPYYHWHLEMVPRLTIPGSFEIGTCMMIDIASPEHCADYLAGRIE